MKIVIAYGTRPEAIKLAPVIRELKLHPSRFKPLIAVTAQHRELLDQVHDFFCIRPDYDLNMMRHGQTLFDISISGLSGVREILTVERPDVLVVQGDTTTAFVAALSAVYLKIPVAHVEAGLRTNSKSTPFPEEINRGLIARLADMHFAPSETARQNLLNEGIDPDRIMVTGNTGVDALFHTLERLRDGNERRAVEQRLRHLFPIEMADIAQGLGKGAKLVLVTGHRRENMGNGLKEICHALKRIAETRPDVPILYCLHPNPNVHGPVHRILGRNSSVKTVGPMDYGSFVYLMKRAHVILTDSGGIQEEAVYLGKHVLLLREATEREEAVETGFVRVVGLAGDTIVRETLNHLQREPGEKQLTKDEYPYGDGRAAERIIQVLEGSYGSVAQGRGIRSDEHR